MHSNPVRTVAILGALHLGLAVAVSSLGDITNKIPVFLSLFGAMFAVYALSVVVISRGGAKERGVAKRRFVVYIVVIAAACRLVCVAADPALSTDIYRYLWEGRVVAAGHNPFALPPDAPGLEHLRDENYAGVSHKQMETIYPPFAQAVFFAGAFLHPNLTTLKLLFVLFDLAALSVILLLLHARGRSLAWGVVYAWSPLVIVEFSHSGHLDSVGIFFLLAALYLWEIATKNRSVVALALSFLSKYLAVLLLPFFVFKRGEAKRILLFAAIVLLGYLPFADEGDKLVASLRTYGARWEFNSAVFPLLRLVLGDAARSRGILLLTLAAFAVYEGHRQKDLTRYAFLVVGCALLLTPTLYPWYLCWIIPFLCFSPSLAWMYLTGIVAASYSVWMTSPATGVWNPGAGILVLEYAPFYALLVVEGVRSLRRRRGVRA
jgi:hypothetical protein